jgi:hypothetical protein
MDQGGDRTSDDQVKKYLGWDNLVRRVENIDQLNKNEQGRAKPALQDLRVALGETFPYRAWKTSHPLSDYLVGITTPWRCRWLMWLASAFTGLKEQEGFKELWRGIQATDQINQAIEGLSVLEVAYKFFKAGFRISFEPSVIVTRKRQGRQSTGPKKPDLKLLNEETKEEVYVEVTALGINESHRLVSHTYDRISALLFPLLSHDYVIYARIHKALSEQGLRDVEARVRYLIEAVRTTNESGILEIPNTIELGIALEKDTDFVHQWASVKGIGPGVTGAVIPMLELPRTRKRVYRKVQQLPGNQSGIIVIHQYNPLFQIYSIEEIVSEIEREVRKYPQLLCVIISHRYLSPSEASDSMEKKGPHLAVRMKIIDPLWENTTILFNDRYKETISNSTLEQLHNSFVKL